MRHPLRWALYAALAVLLVAFAPALWRMVVAPEMPAAMETGMPWQVTVAADGRSSVFGLLLPGSTLAQARQRWGDDLQVAVMAQRGQGGALEAYLENFRAGPLSGRLVLAADAGADAVARWRGRAVREAPVDADARRVTLRADDLAEALQVPLTGITFLPAANLDADTVRARFGPPAAQWQLGDRQQHWLYPRLGLAIAIDTEGRDVLQYVAPADFERRLRAPLQAAGATPVR